MGGIENGLVIKLVHATRGGVCKSLQAPESSIVGKNETTKEGSNV